MKTFQNFCEDANIQEFWNPFAPKQTAKPITKPKSNTKVLAYKNYKPGVLDKSTGEFTPRPHNDSEKNRYGWQPVTVSTYSKADTPGSLTASGHKFDDKQRLVAVPYTSRTNTKPSIPFGTNLQITKAPGTKAPVATTTVRDTGNFGAAGDYNKSVYADAALQTTRDFTGNPNITARQAGKQKVYVRTLSQPKSKIPDLGVKVDMSIPKIVPTKKK